MKITRFSISCAWPEKSDIAAGRLIQVLADWTPAVPGPSLYYPGRRLVPAGLRAFIDLIREVNAGQK